MLKLSPSSEITSRLVRLARIYRAGIDDALSGLGLSDALALPVIILGRRPEGVRQSELADDLGLEGPSLVRILDRLVDDGLVERREDPKDRRAKLVTLTPSGQAHSREASGVLDAYRALLLEGVSDADLEATLRVFHVTETRLSSARRGDPT